MSDCGLCLNDPLEIVLAKSVSDSIGKNYMQVFLPKTVALAIVLKVVHAVRTLLIICFNLEICMIDCQKAWSRALNPRKKK